MKLDVHLNFLRFKPENVLNKFLNLYGILSSTKNWVVLQGIMQEETHIGNV